MTDEQRKFVESFNQDIDLHGAIPNTMNVEVPLGVLKKCRDIIEKQDRALEKCKTELHRMHNCNFTSLLEATAWMGIPERKRDAFIKAHMSNADFIRDKCLKELDEIMEGVE